MEKIRFVKYENIPGHVVGSCEGYVFDTDPIACGYTGGAPECGGGIYVEEQKPVKQNVTEQEEQKRVKYVAVTLFKLEQCYFTESLVFDSQKEAQKWLVGNHLDLSAVSFEIVEMEY